MAEIIDARTQGGASTVEYGILLALVATFIVGVVALLGHGLVGTFERSIQETREMSNTEPAA